MRLDKLLRGKAMHDSFEMLYGTNRADHCMQRLNSMSDRYGIDQLGKPPRVLTEADTLLITYGDMVRDPASETHTPLRLLRLFFHEQLGDAFSMIHLLPFFPYSSDDGFSVLDYRVVDPALGTWKEVTALSQEAELMFDFVLNHVSRGSTWFEDFVRGVAPYRDYFIAVNPQAALRNVTRPRDLPLLTPVSTAHGELHLWTTFSSDQIDLNYGNPDVLFDMLDVLFQYIVQGASFIRMDAIAYLWKEIGTTCIHLPQTHQVVKLFRDIVDMIAPHVVLLTETNVPHAENVSYFGEGDEARMVYQFALPPLLLHTLIAEEAGPLTDWAAALEAPPPGCAFLNFTASHDGVGVRPLEGLLAPSQIQALLQHTESQGGSTSYKKNSDGTKSAYELNVTYYDALGKGAEDALQADRFLCSQLIAMSLQGVPAVYFNSLLAAPNDHEGVKATGRARSINRHKWTPDEILASLDHGGNPVFTRYVEALRLRRGQPAFSPQSPQVVLSPAPGIFALLRGEPGDGAVLCIFNVTSRNRVLPSFSRIAPSLNAESAVDLLSGKTLSAGQSVRLAPFQARWLRV